MRWGCCSGLLLEEEVPGGDSDNGAVEHPLDCALDHAKDERDDGNRRFAQSGFEQFVDFATDQPRLAMIQPTLAVRLEFLSGEKFDEIVRPEEMTGPRA